MPKFISECGYVIDLSRIPGEYEHKLISEVEIEKFVDLIENNNLTLNSFFDILDSNSTTVYKCPNCGRMYLEEEKGKFVSYHCDVSR